MHKHYIINEIVEFHPVDGTLRDLSNPDRVVVLNSPAGRCLLLLIERAGTIVTQQECMDIVWQRRGMLVSPNTYYQNISVLRKGLRKIGFQNDPIVTIPRIGLTLASETTITIKEVPRQASEDHEYDTARSDEASASQAEPTAQPTIAVYSPRRMRWWTKALLVVLLFSGAGVINHSFSRSNLFIDDYYFASTVGACRVYLANSIQAQDERAMALTYVGQFKDGCVNYPWVYIGRYARLPRASVIRCDRSMKEPNRCISDYFIEDR
ncbi:winged helix-turn-helix domain-containing protein [Raoultella terrigena]|uniref:winged helix-turn-helix domain-containing protein n=1 Tax=Raoultella terrigena TaxID=577 RepID=UPI001431295B|nr:winged helix-turn-helix domain-containing protein [Raoultella terrigena]QIT27129.1 transcriptional regulator [Raoultella terrigena]